MENPFLDDAIYCLRRASKALCLLRNRDSFYDAAIYYAFGMEKLFKAIIHDVNPVFLLEGSGFENAISALYDSRLIERSRKKADKDVNRSLIPFQASMLRAAKFSQSVEDNIGKFTRLADIRGALAHRNWTEIDVPKACEFLLLTFTPTVELFAEEMEFDADSCFESENDRERLKKVSDDLAAQENFGDYIKDTLAKHLAIWVKRKDNPLEMQKAATATQALLGNFTPGGPYTEQAECPCCEQSAVLFYRFIDRYGQDEVAIIGAYAIGLSCCYCDVDLAGYRAVDHFKLNDQVKATFGGKQAPSGLS